ncbi:UVR8 [Symbiodinium natans]|uniref:UVR8 protein n=1 Tax=Symbiodinium natans TaxID=878477 RepID=A0A812M0I3_9DINO|nr:UVR8 [Symbiodinium natans]
MSASRTYLSARNSSIPTRELHHMCWIIASLRQKPNTEIDKLSQILGEVVLPFLATPVPAFPSRSAAAAGCDHTCPVKASGELMCFGLNDEDQCDVPTDLGPVVAVAAGGGHTCAVKASGELVCFGRNNEGQCDVPADLGLVVAVSAGAYHTCAVKVSGELVCFGWNLYAQCDVPAELGPVVAVAAGDYHTCAVKASGELVCFGLNECGECDVPAGFGPVEAVAAGAFRTCAVKASGELVCFGENWYGECDVPADLGPVVAVAAGEYHTCAVKVSGELVCFGNNDNGQCDVQADLGAVVAVAAGDYHTCAVKANGELVCFGRNWHGQCDVPANLGFLLAGSAKASPFGDGDGPARPADARVDEDVRGAEAAAQSPPEAAAIVAEKEASFIGHNESARWVDTEAAEPDVPRNDLFRSLVLLEFTRCPPELNEVLQHSAALRPTRVALAREGFHWRLPNGAKVFMDPRLFRLLCSHRTVDLRAYHVLVQEDLEGSVMAAAQQLQPKLRARLRSSTTVGLADADGDEIALVRRTFLHLPSTRLLHPNSVVQSTTEAGVRRLKKVPTPYLDKNTFVNVRLSIVARIPGEFPPTATSGVAYEILEPQDPFWAEEQFAVCLLRRRQHQWDAKNLWVPPRELHHMCWIIADLRRTASTEIDKLTQTLGEVVLPFLATPVPAYLSRSAVDAGESHTCAVKASGELVCFGGNEYGERDVPADLGPVVAVAAGTYHTCAVKASGELVCFGRNQSGQCDVPADLGPVVAVAAGGGHHTCAVKASGELVCFGRNEYGQCDVPADLGPVVAVAAGRSHTCAVKPSGDLVCFGWNYHGECDVPADLGPVVAVAAGVAHTCAVKASGELVCFGWNEYGQCDVPADLGPVVAVAAGTYHTCAVKASGELVCFGRNEYGQCDVPADLGPLVAVAAGPFHTCAVKENGELVCVGLNKYGQCDVPENLGPLLAGSARTFPSDADNGPARFVHSPVVQDVQHEEAAAEIPPDEAAAIVAEQQASFIEHNIESAGWVDNIESARWVDTDTEAAEPDVPRNDLFRSLVLLEFTRCPPELNEVLQHSAALRPTRMALAREGFHWRLPNGAKVFMDPRLFRLLRSYRMVDLRAHHVLAAEDLEGFVLDAVQQLRSRLRVRLRSSTTVALADGDEIALVRRTFLHLPSTQLLRPNSVVQSTTEARPNHGANPRRVFAHHD